MKKRYTLQPHQKGGSASILYLTPKDSLARIVALLFGGWYRPSCHQHSKILNSLVQELHSCVCVKKMLDCLFLMSTSSSRWCLTHKQVIDHLWVMQTTEEISMISRCMIYVVQSDCNLNHIFLTDWIHHFLKTLEQDLGSWWWYASHRHHGMTWVHD